MLIFTWLAIKIWFATRPMALGAICLPFVVGIYGLSRFTSEIYRKNRHFPATNVALYKPAYHSTTLTDQYQFYNANFSTDGKLDGVCSSTVSNDSSPWLQVDLLDVYKIYAVEIKFPFVSEKTSEFWFKFKFFTNFNRMIFVFKKKDFAQAFDIAILGSIHDGLSSHVVLNKSQNLVCYTHKGELGKFLQLEYGKLYINSIRFFKILIDYTLLCVRQISTPDLSASSATLPINLLAFVKSMFCLIKQVWNIPHFSHPHINK